MEHAHRDDTLTVRLSNDFNWLAVQQIEPLTADATHIRIDLSDVRLLDTEALMLIERLQRAGKTVQLIDPPDLLYDLIDLLELDPALDVDALVA
jgi:ABC-type transporter Mla MlaB component